MILDIVVGIEDEDLNIALISMIMKSSKKGGHMKG
jgi:hypothetical protein